MADRWALLDSAAEAKALDDTLLALIGLGTASRRADAKTLSYSAAEPAAEGEKLVKLVSERHLALLDKSTVDALATEKPAVADDGPR